MRIIDLLPGSEDAIRQTAAVLVEGFAAHSPQAYPNLESGLEEVRESFGEDRISRIAVDEDGTILGWIGAISRYMGLGSRIFLWQNLLGSKSAWSNHPGAFLF